MTADFDSLRRPGARQPCLIAASPAAAHVSPTHSSSRAQAGRAWPWLLGAVLVAGAAAALWWPHGNAGGASSVATAAGNPGPASGPGGPAGPGGRRFGPGGPGRVQAVSVARVRQQDISLSVQAIGAITASNTAVVKAKIEGELKALRFTEGQLVQAGAVLAELDNRPQQIALAQVEGQLARDRAQLDNARIDLARFEELLAKDGISKQQVDTQAALVRQLQGTVQSDQAVVDNARLQLSYTRITAPITGRVGLKQADLGNVVKPGDANGLLTIAQTQPANVVFAVPDQHLPRIRELLKQGERPRPASDAKASALVVEAWDRDQKHRLATGRVASIDNAIDAATGTIKLKASFANADGSLYPNQFVNVRLRLGTVQGALAVPAAALLRNGEGSFVYLVGEDHIAHVRPVTPGPADGDWVGVQGDLKPGDRVVVDGVDRLRDGSTVEIIAAPGQGGDRRGDRRGDKRADGERRERNDKPA